MSRLLRLAILLSSLLHGILILAARYRLSYDAYVHMFFADHYRRDWWSLWDERWYTGLPVISYPPLVHQLMAGLSQVIGLDAAFGLMLWITVTLLPLAVYCFARIFVGRVSAGYAALGAVFLPSVYLTAHIFGQLPFLFGTVLALFGAASLARYLKDGELLDLLLTLAITTTTMAAHHAVLMIQPFLVFAVVLKLFLSRRNMKSQENDEARPEYSKLALRTIVFGVTAIVLSLLIVFPFWEWGRTQEIQTPIDHASRHNFFKDPLAPLLFFLPMYGPLMIIIPAALYLAAKRQLLGLGIAFTLLFLLGLGGTTPLPRLIFGMGWEWLTYDRFAFWATLTLLPFFGMILIQLRRKRSRRFSTKILAVLGACCLIVALSTTVWPFQPGAVDMSRIVSFLAQGDRSSWRYLTFGFGDQLALLSTLTTATTIDGSYHTSRSLPELRTSGIGQIDTAFWLPNGLSALDPILQKAGERGVRWGFVNTPQYIPVLERNGWKKVVTLKGGVQVWENPEAIQPAASIPPRPDPFASFAWGTFPMLALITTLSLASFRVAPIQAERVLRHVFSFLISLIPLALCFWYYRTVGEFPHPRVYFTYDHSLFFISDALAVLAILLWGSVKITRAAQSQTDWRTSITQPSAFHVLLLALFLLSILSILWSSDWRTSLFISLHVGLAFLLIFSLRDWKTAWKPAMFGLCAALTFQIMAGFGSFALQSTAFLEPLDLKWPGLLDPSIRGASVVQLQNGLRILRAYGSLPHPNILGGFALICLLGPGSLFMSDKRIHVPALILYTLGLILILFTFSRSAWLGVAAFLFILFLKSKHLERRRVILLLTVSAITVILTLLPLQELVITRLSNQTVQTEHLSTFGRAWLTEQSLEMIRMNPIFGVGIGSFILELAGSAVEGAIIEPVHNVFLLIGAELGIIGLLVIAALPIVIMVNIVKAKNPQAILASATLTGLGVISLFDHYFWSIPPGRLMLGFVLGLWAGQLANDGE